ncbi:MAG: hypothetical protein AB8B85_01420, partial [Paracoccaceae bacterium]
MTLTYSGDGRIDNNRILAGSGYGLLNSVLADGETGTVESFSIAENFNPTDLVRGSLIFANNTTVSFEDLGSGDPVNGFSPFARIGQTGSAGGIADGYVGVLSGSVITLANSVIEDANGQFQFGYSPLQVGSGFGGFGDFRVSDAGSAAYITGGPARLDVGRSGGVGLIDIANGGKLGAFNLTAGREGFALVSVDGSGSELALVSSYGTYGSAYTGQASSSAIGRDFNGRGILAVFDGGTVRVENEDGVTDDPDLVLGRGYGSHGYAVISGDGSSLNITQFGPLDDDIFGGSFRLGDGGRGVVLVEDGGALNVTGADSFIGIGEDRDGRASRFESQLVIRSSATVAVDATGNVEAANVQVGRSEGARGALLVDGAGSELLVRSDSGVAGASSGGLFVGFEGEGRLEVTNGGKIRIEGGDDLFPQFHVGSGSSSTVNPAAATSVALVSGVGSEVLVSGTNTSSLASSGFISVGRRDQKTGILTIEDGAAVRNTGSSSSAEVGGNPGSTGVVIVQGAGSVFEAGEFLSIGTDNVAGAFDTSIGGDGTLTLLDGGYASAGNIYVGDSGILNLGGTLAGDTVLTGVLNVGDDDAAGLGTVNGNLDALNGQVELELLDFTTGATDLLNVTGAFDIGSGQLVLDASNLARATQGDVIGIVSAGSLTPGFSLGGIAVNGTPSGVALSLARSGGNISVSVSIAPSKTVGLFGGDVSITEGDPGEDMRVELTLLRSGDLLTGMDVDFAVSGGTADQFDFGTFTLPTGTVSFGVGEDSATFEILLNEDDANEGDETFNVVLTSVSTGNGSAASILNDTTTVTIIDDDAAPSTITNGNVVVGDPYPNILQVISLDPASTYLNVDAGDAPVNDAVALDLTALGFGAGSALFLDVQGAFDPFGNGSPEREFSLGGVFSGSDVLSAQTDINRVVDALAPVIGTPAYTSVDSYFGTARDIAEDFLVGTSGAHVVVPDGATHLFLSPADTYFSNNTDANGDFSVVAFRPTVIGFDGDGDATFINETRQDAAVVIGSNGSGGEAFLDDTQWNISSDLRVGEFSGSGRLILEGKSQVNVQDQGLYGHPTDPSVRIGTNGGNGYLAVVGGSDVLIGSDLKVHAADVVTGGYNHLQIGTNTGLGAVLVEGEGSTVTAYGYSSRIVLGQDGGRGELNIRDGAEVRTLSLNAGRREGDGFVNIAGAGSTLHLSNAFGQYGSAQYRGSGSFSTFGRDSGEGNLRVTDGGRVLIENVDSVTDVSALRFGREYGSSGFGEVSGEGSRIDIYQHGRIGDNCFGSPGLYVGQGGRGELVLSDGADVLIQGDSARLSVARGRDALGAPDASELQVLSGATVLVDSQNYGRAAQIFYDGGGSYAGRRDGGARMDVGDGANTQGIVSVDGAGSSLTLRSTSIEADDNNTAEIRLGGLGTGTLNVSNGGCVTARELELGVGFYDTGTETFAGQGFVSITLGGRIVLDTPDNPLKATDPVGQPSAYRGLRLAVADSTYGRVDVDGDGSELTSSGGGGLVEIGANGTGRLGITNGGLVQGFYVLVGNYGQGYLSVDGAGSGLVSSSTFGEFGLGNDQKAAALTLGRSAGSYGRLDISNGGAVTLQNDPNSIKDAPLLQVGGSYGAEGVVSIQGGLLDIRLFGPSDDALEPGVFNGPELRLGQDGSAATVSMDGGSIEISGEAAKISVGHSADSNGNAILSALSNTNGTIAVSSSNSAYGASVVVGELDSSQGYLSLNGAAANMDIGTVGVDNFASDNLTPIYGAQLLIADGVNSTGEVRLADGASITTTGDDNFQSGMFIGNATGAVGQVFVSGGSSVSLSGYSTLFDAGSQEAFGMLSVGTEAGATGRLMISEGSEVTASGAVEIGGAQGATGEVTVVGPGSVLVANTGLMIGADLDPLTGNISFQGGTGTLTVDDNATVTFDFGAEIGENGTLNLDGFLLGSGLTNVGRVNVGGDGSIGNAVISSATTNLDGAEIAFEFEDVEDGLADLLTFTGTQNAVDFATPNVLLDVSNLGTVQVGESVKFVDFDSISAPDPQLFLNTTFTFVGVPTGLGLEVVEDAGGDWLVEVISVAGEILGTPDADDLVGGASDETILALAGDDTVDAGGGQDFVDLGLGDDTGDGGAGIDTLSFASLAAPGFVFGDIEVGVIVDLYD